MAPRVDALYRQGHNSSYQKTRPSGGLVSCQVVAYSIGLQDRLMIAPVDSLQRGLPLGGPSEWRGEPFSSRNLIVNGGFAVVLTSAASGWRVVTQPGMKSHGAALPRRASTGPVFRFPPMQSR